MLPTREAVCSLPPLLSNCTPQRTPDLGANGHSVSPADTSSETVDDAGSRMDTGFRHDSAQLGTMSHENENGARCRVRTCVNDIPRLQGLAGMDRPRSLEFSPSGWISFAVCCS